MFTKPPYKFALNILCNIPYSSFDKLLLSFRADCVCVCAIVWLVVWVHRPQRPSIKDFNLHFPNILSTVACDGQLGRVFVCWVGIQSLMSLCLCQCARFASSAWWTFLWLTQLCRGHHTHTNVCACTHKHTLWDCIMVSLQPPLRSHHLVLVKSL